MLMFGVHHTCVYLSTSVFTNNEVSTLKVNGRRSYHISVHMSASAIITSLAAAAAAAAAVLPHARASTLCACARVLCVHVCLCMLTPCLLI